MIGSPNKNESQKQARYYLRFHQTIKRALKYNEKLYGNKLTKDKRQLKTAHPMRVAYLTEHIREQWYYNYHLNWLVGLLHDSKEDDIEGFSDNIDEITQDLLPSQKQDTLRYINQLSKDRTLAKGSQKREQVDRMKKLDLVPSYIKIFDKYDNCKRFLIDGCGKTPSQLYGYYAVSLICYDLAIEKHPIIKENLQEQIKQFYQDLRAKIGNENKIKEFAEYYYQL